MATVRVRVPSIKNIELAIQLYYTKHELSRQDIMRIFEVSNTTAYKLKQLANAHSDEKNTPRYNASYTNTADAFEAWGIDIKRLEEGYKHLKKLGFGA